MTSRPSRQRAPRHGAVQPAEVARILGPGGTFLTQQVVPDSWRTLRPYFPRMAVFPDHWLGYADEFRVAGYGVEAPRSDYRIAFSGLEDLVAMLALNPWLIADFDVEGDLEALFAVERELMAPEGIILPDGRYLLEAQKPA